MDRVVHVRSDVCRVLEEDADLAESIPAELRGQAVRECIARTAVIGRGAWPASSMGLHGDGIGLLVLDGLVTRRVDVEGRLGSELLGEGDLLRPWQEDEQPVLAMTTGWRVIEALRVAVLDEQFALRAARYPQVTGRIVGRAVQRSRDLVVNMAIVHQARVDVRLHLLLWHLAGRWGRVRSDGVSLSLPVTHDVLADLVAARRPTVTSALAELARRGTVLPTDGGWLLTGRPPGASLASRSLRAMGSAQVPARAAG